MPRIHTPPIEAQVIHLHAWWQFLLIAGDKFSHDAMSELPSPTPAKIAVSIRTTPRLPLPAAGIFGAYVHF
jgi:hypothetical protein